MDYKGLRDRHLNVFCGYAVEHLENNITKAMINTLDSLSPQKQAEIYSFLIKSDVSSEELNSKFYLQQKPNDREIDQIAKENRYIIGISPTGKCWGYSAEDIQDDVKMMAVIAKEWKQDHQDISDEELNEVVQNVINGIHERRENKGSVPDAWIIVTNKYSEYLIIFENKLYNLDPDQINNHIEKSLKLNDVGEKERALKYYTFEQISEEIGHCNTYMSDQFVEYLTILRYIELDSLQVACSADKDIRGDLMAEVGKTIMKDIFGDDVDKRSRYAVRKKLGNGSILREINLCFDRCNDVDGMAGTVYISLAVAPIMSIGRWVYENITLPVEFDNKHIQKPFASFHLQFNRGRNIGKSYLRGVNWEVNDYIDYWKRHVTDLKLMHPQEAAMLIERMCIDGKVPLEQATDLSSYLREKKNLINVVPEIIYEITWTCEEISRMTDNTEFETAVKEALCEFLNMTNCKVQGLNC